MKALQPLPAVAGWPARRIAFATDMTESEQPALALVVTLAKQLRAEIIIAHIDKGSYDHEFRKMEWHSFVDKTREDPSAPLLYYRNIAKPEVTGGLQALAVPTTTDLLAMTAETLRLPGVLPLCKDLPIPLLIFSKT